MINVLLAMDSTNSGFDPLIVVWIAGGLFLLVALLLRWLARRAAARLYILGKATPMSLALVNVRDDVWLRGTARCEQPCSVPFFDRQCLFFAYKLEERVRKTRRDSKGKTKTSYHWKTRESDSASAPFWLVEGERSIAVDHAAASFEGLESTTHRAGSWRHSARFLPYPGEITAVGTVGEKRAILEPHANIPLIVMRQTRDQYLQTAYKAQRWKARAGFVLLWLGLCALAAALSIGTGWPLPRTPSEPFPMADMFAGLLAGSALFVPLSLISVFNTLIARRNRVENAWHQLDVDLKHRYDLIPRLVDVAGGYMTHEKQALERIAALRSEAISGGRDARIGTEGAMAGQLATIIAVAEDYPELDAQPMLAKVHRELVAIEEKIAHGRNTYCNAVETYNNVVEQFPTSVVAGAFGFGHKAAISLGASS